uniref:DUF7666 domain-containing protein n=1 Tax=virus sp. ctCsQ3 TaxID=2826794 RepID=A0A8S5R6W9_9VIRU|nr:MAG TPA: hypothetical protein [virus sp. ctCsQ3]
MSVKGYKAFNKGMICRGKQYEENTTYEENGNEICEAGVMHYCENPFDTLDYYPLVNENGEISEFAEVEPLGKVFKRENKCATNKLHIKAKLGLKGFIKACVDFTLEKTKIEEIEDGIENDNGNNSAKIGSSGDSAQIGSSGDSAQIGSSGDSAQIGSSGYSAQIGSSGDYAKITSKGKNSVVMAAGYNSIAKAKIGSWITLAEWIRTDKTNDSGKYIWIPKCVKTECVDGEHIKEDTFYKLVNGEFKEVESEE